MMCVYTNLPKVSLKLRTGNSQHQKLLKIGTLNVKERSTVNSICLHKRYWCRGVWESGVGGSGGMKNFKIGANT